MMEVSILIEHDKFNQIHIKLFITFEIYFALIQLEKVLSTYLQYMYIYTSSMYVSNVVLPSSSLGLRFVSCSASSQTCRRKTPDIWGTDCCQGNDRRHAVAYEMWRRIKVPKAYIATRQQLMIFSSAAPFNKPFTHRVQPHSTVKYPRKASEYNENHSLNILSLNLSTIMMYTFSF